MLRSTSPAIDRQVSNRSLKLAAVVLATLTLAACGGGGGGDSSPPPSSPSTPPPPPPTTPTNTAPTVNAGADQSVTLPSNQVTLNGSATDAENNTLTYAWTSSPADGVTFTAASAAATQATFTTAGTYTLTLTANDGTTTGTDTVVVTVNSAPPPATPTISWPAPNPPASDANQGWEAVANASDVGMNATLLADAETYALKGGGSGLVSRYGKLVRKWGDIDARVDVKSTTKSIGGIALALALDDQKVTLADKAQARLPAFGTDPALAATPNDPAALASISLLNLATHTAGFDKPRTSDVKLLPELLPVGSKWSYSDGGLNWLADALTNVYQSDLNRLLFDRVFTPIGITTGDLQWRTVPVNEARPPVPGVTQRELAGGITANTNAMARIGLLYLRKGTWNGTPIISETSVGLAMKPVSEIAGSQVAKPLEFPASNLNYGLLWWTNANKQMPDVPADAFWAWGLADSLIVVIPSLDLVIARVDGSPDSTTTPHWRANSTTGYPVWNGDYKILEPFLVPIVKSVTPTP